jgi:hypothetical protein
MIKPATEGLYQYNRRRGKECEKAYHLLEILWEGRAPMVCPRIALPARKPRLAKYFNPLSDVRARCEPPWHPPCCESNGFSGVQVREG